jgi:hypothetical protein
VSIRAPAFFAFWGPLLHRLIATREHAIARFAQTRKIVASPRKMKNPPMSVIAVIITLDPTAGS